VIESGWGGAVVETLRLVLRVEGEKWNAYVANKGTMEGALWIGGIALKFVKTNERRKQAFIDLMTDALSEALKDISGQQPTWRTVPAPKNERGGDA
jgi:hypothetical protein